MKDFNNVPFLLLLLLLFVFLTTPVFAGSVNLPRTGQTKCYDTSGNEIDCTGTGQDGEIQAGVAWPNPRFRDNADDTVTDNLTGLMWMKYANLTAKMTWYDAIVYCDMLNLGGYTDWRLPNQKELRSLIDYSQYDPALPSDHPFTSLQVVNDWSSTTVAFYTGYAWLVGISSGYVDFDDKSGNLGYVWPVRSGQCGLFVDSVICLPKTGQTTSYYSGDDGDLEKGVSWPSPRFAGHKNGTVTDNLTGLMWPKNANLSVGYLTWQQALDYVAGMNTGTYPNFSYTDWRLPNVNELESLVNAGEADTAAWLNTQGFTSVQADVYWSSTTVATYPVYAWHIYMWDGYVYYGDKSYSYSFWPVRGGQVACSTWSDVIVKYNAYVSEEAVWDDVITCYTQYTSS